MTPVQLLEIFAAFLTEIGKLIAAGISKDEALRRIRRLGDDAKTIDQDVDLAADGRATDH